jgi:hypothetical protein
MTLSKDAIIWAVIYNHPLGVDIWVADEVDLAYKKALEIVAALRDHYEVPKDVSNEEALEDLAGWTHGAGHIEIVCADVLEKSPTFYEYSFEDMTGLEVMEPPEVGTGYIPTEEDLMELARLIEEDEMAELLESALSRQQQ